MDPDNCDVIIKVLSNVLNRLIDVNKSHVGQQLITKFQSSYPPEVSIHAYLERIKKYAGCSDSCFVVALIYIDRMIEIRNVVLTSLNVHRLIITSLMLAAKFFDDYFYNNAFYAKLGGVASIEMNSLELEFLQLLNFSLFVSPEVYLKYHAELRNYVGVVNIPVYLSSSFPNSPTTDKITKGNSFLSRPPSTSPFLPLVEMARFPTPPLLDVAFDQNQKVQSYYQHLLEHNSSVPQVSQYESLSPMSQRTFINSSLSPCEEPVPVPFGYSPSSSFGADQIPLGRNQYGQYCVVPMPQGSQYYPHGNQGCHPKVHFSYQKAYLVNEVSSGQFNQPSLENEDGGQRGYQFKRHDTYDSYRRPMDSMPDGNCLQHGVSPLSYSHQTLQMMSTCPAVSQCSPYIQSNLQNDSNDNEYYRVQNGGQTDVAPQPHYYPVPIPFSGHSSNHLSQTHLRDMRSIRPDILPIQTGPSPLDFMRNSIATHTNGHQYSAHQQKSQTGSFRNDQYFTRQETSSLSSFSDDNCDSGSGATTPASERSLASSSGLSSRASLLSVSSDGSLCSSNVSPPIFLSQPNGSYYKHLQQQQPHYITAS